MQARMWPDDPSPGAARSATQAASASRTPDRNGGSAPRSVLTVTRRPGDAGPEGGDEPCRRAPGSSACRSVRTGRRTSVSRWETPDRISAETDVGEPFDGGTPVGVALVAPDYTIIVADAAAQMWLAELCDGARDGVPHLAVRTVVGTARRIAAGQAPHGVVAEARVRAASGRWLLLRGSTLGDGRGVPTALIVEPARPHELAVLVAESYGLTLRERAVVQLVAQGLSTSVIGGRLHLSAWTVQDHLKSTFEKVGVGSRGELVARLFFDDHVPSLTREPISG